MIDKIKNNFECIEEIDLKKYNTLKLNSKAKLMVFPKNEKELIEVLELLKDEKHFVIGNGSNIILPNYYDGVIIKLEKLNNYKIEDDILYVESGAMINYIANTTANMGYGGLDYATGIPGTIGGSIYGNAGCYGSSISDVLIDAKVYDGDKIITLKNKDFMFKYRYSMLKDNKDLIIISARFKLEKKDKEELKKQILERTNKRIATQDLSHPSNGSMFRNPEGLIAGKLIDDLGLKGYHVNDAMVSLKHANFIINNGNATQEDIIKLVEKIKKDVKKEYDIDLVMEQEIIK